MRMRHSIPLSVTCLAVPCFSTLSHKDHDFRKKVAEYITCVLIFSTTFSDHISFKNEMSEILSYMFIGLRVKYALLLSAFNL
jgi:hypothetical protein